MRYRAILVVESEDIDHLTKKIEHMGNVKIIDIFDSKENNWLMSSKSRDKILKRYMYA